MIHKLLDITRRQELDTYNPYLELPKSTTLYLKKMENLIKSEVVRVKCTGCYKIFEWTLNDMALIDQ